LALIVAIKNPTWYYLVAEANKTRGILYPSLYKWERGFYNCRTLRIAKIRKFCKISKMAVKDLGGLKR